MLKIPNCCIFQEGGEVGSKCVGTKSHFKQDLGIGSRQQNEGTGSRVRAGARGRGKGEWEAGVRMFRAGGRRGAR